MTGSLVLEMTALPIRPQPLPPLGSLWVMVVNIQTNKVTHVGFDTRFIFYNFWNVFTDLGIVCHFASSAIYIVKLVNCLVFLSKRIFTYFIMEVS